LNSVAALSAFSRPVSNAFTVFSPTTFAFSAATFAFSPTNLPVDVARDASPLSFGPILVTTVLMASTGLMPPSTSFEKSSIVF
jgi:hypothetical protein